MIRNVDGTYIYLVVPAKYECVYTKLLVKMTDLGVDLLKDCASTCRGINRQVLNCWNMFQAACCAYELGEYKKADLLINYINASLKFACQDNVSPALSSFKLNITDLKGNQTAKVSQATFVIDNLESAKPDSLGIVFKNTNTIIAEGLSLTSPVNFTEFSFDAKVGDTYTWYATVQDLEGNEFKSNEYTIRVTEADRPSIVNFAINIASNIEGAQTVTYDRATFAITNKEKAKPNSLKIIYIGTSDTVIAEGLSIDSPSSFSTKSIDMTVGNSYKWKATIEDEDGNIYVSNIYTVNCVAPPKRATMFYGSTNDDGSAGVVAFKSKKATELMTLPHTDKEIVGNAEQMFTIRQTENVHWLLIPTEEMELIHSEFGTVLISVLWDKTTQDSSYKQPFDAGEYDGKKYTMFFLYLPGGALNEDIRISVKNL